jgi:hypothetical protein
MKYLLSLLLLATLAVSLFAQGTAQPPSSNPPLFRGGDRKDKGDDENVRSLQGLVTDEAGNALEGAVVKLKDTKTLRVRSFITQKDGNYRFHGLSTNVDYEVWADHGDKASDQRTLSVFDSRKQAVINLKLDKKKQAKS